MKKTQNDFEIEQLFMQFSGSHVEIFSMYEYCLNNLYDKVPDLGVSGEAFLSHS